MPRPKPRQGLKPPYNGAVRGLFAAGAVWRGEGCRVNLPCVPAPPNLFLRQKRLGRKSRQEGGPSWNTPSARHVCTACPVVRASGGRGQGRFPQSDIPSDSLGREVVAPDFGVSPRPCVCRAVNVQRSAWRAAPEARSLNREFIRDVRTAEARHGVPCRARKLFRKHPACRDVRGFGAGDAAASSMSSAVTRPRGNRSR